METRAKRSDERHHRHARARHAETDAEMWTERPSARGQIALSFNSCRADGRTLEFIKDQYRHCKPMLAWGDSAQLLDACGIPAGESDSGLIVVAVDSPDAADQLGAAIAKHRHFARETDPPRV